MPWKALWRALRPWHWIKNVFVAAPLVFAGEWNHSGAVLRTAAAVGVFCLAASAVYLLNDLLDLEADRRHPLKRLRPLAAGELSRRAAALGSMVLAAGALAGAWLLGPAFAAVTVSFLCLNVAYSVGLKAVPIVDVLAVAAGFLLRAWAGGVVLEVKVSHWLVLCTGLLAMLLAFGKRKAEFQRTAGNAPAREVLEVYTEPFLDQCIGLAAAATLLAYALYAFSPEVAAKLGTPYMGLTLPFVAYGLLRYLWLLFVTGAGEDPTEHLRRDVPMMAAVVFWGLTVLALLAFRNGLP